MNLSGHPRQRYTKHRQGARAHKRTRRPQPGDKISKIQKMRMRYYEFKIEVFEFCEKIASSLFPQTGTQKANKGNVHTNIAKTVQRSPEKSPSYDGITQRKTKMLRPYSDMEALQRNRKSISNKSESVDRFRNHGSSYRDSWRKQRSSLTRRKGSRCDDNQWRDSFRRTSTKSLGIGDKTASSGCRKPSSASVMSRRISTKRIQQRISQNKGKFYKSESAEESSLEYSTTTTYYDDQTDDDESTDVSEPKCKTKSKNKKKRDLKEEESQTGPPDETSNKNEETSQLPQPLPFQPRRTQVPTFDTDVEENTKGFFSRFIDSLFVPRKRKYDPNKLPPKTIKFGIQLNTEPDKERKRRDPLNKLADLVGLDQIFSQDAPEEDYPTTSSIQIQSEYYPTPTTSPLYSMISRHQHTPVYRSTTGLGQSATATDIDSLLNTLKATRPTTDLSKDTAQGEFRSFFRRRMNLPFKEATLDSKPTVLPNSPQFKNDLKDPPKNEGTTFSPPPPRFSSNLSASIAPTPTPVVTSPSPASATMSPLPTPTSPLPDSALHTPPASISANSGPKPSTEYKASPSPFISFNDNFNSTIYNPRTEFTAKYIHLLQSN